MKELVKKRVLISWREVFFLWSFGLNSCPELLSYTLWRLLYPGGDKSRGLLLDRWKHLLQWAWISLKRAKYPCLSLKNSLFILFSTVIYIICGILHQQTNTKKQLISYCHNCSVDIFFFFFPSGVRSLHWSSNKIQIAIRGLIWRCRS